MRLAELERSWSGASVDDVAPRARCAVFGMLSVFSRSATMRFIVLDRGTLRVSSV